MSNGVFGTIRPANLNVENDVEILYYYRPSRGETSDDFTGYRKLDASECLVPTKTEEDEKVIDGLFNLKLPLDEFNRKGFYTIYIRPREIDITIADVSVLAAYPDVKGVIFKLDQFEDLTGYRIELGGGITRLIKSCNICEPVVVNTSDGYAKTTRYNLTDNGSSYVFCTVTPSSSPTFKVNAAPYIGEPGLTVKLVNTKFTPQVFEIEMVEHDADTISYMLEGDQVNDRDNAIITTYNDKHQIYHQADYYVLKDKLGNPLNTIKKKRSNIDHGQDYDNVID